MCIVRKIATPKEAHSYSIHIPLPIPPRKSFSSYLKNLFKIYQQYGGTIYFSRIYNLFCNIRIIDYIHWTLTDPTKKGRFKPVGGGG